MTKVAVDIGNSITKFCSGGVLKMVNSKVDIQASVFGEKATKVEFDGKSYYIDKGDFEVGYIKHEKKNFLPLLYYAICEATSENVIELAIGCPILQYNKPIVEKIKSVIGKSAEVKITKNNRTYKRSLVFEKVEVFPESVGAYMANKSDISGKHNVIVDMGSRTTDICLINDDNIQTSNSLYEGVIDVFASLIKEIMKSYPDLKLKIEDGEEILKTGVFTYDGKKVSCEFALPAIAKHFQEVYKELQVNYNPKSADCIFVTGGGSELLGQVLQEKLNNVVINNDLFANVKGFYELL